MNRLFWRSPQRDEVPGRHSLFMEKRSVVQRNSNSAGGWEPRETKTQANSQCAGSQKRFRFRSDRVTFAAVEAGTDVAPEGSASNSEEEGHCDSPEFALHRRTSMPQPKRCRRFALPPRSTWGAGFRVGLWGEMTHESASAAVKSDRLKGETFARRGFELGRTSRLWPQARSWRREEIGGRPFAGAEVFGGGGASFVACSGRTPGRP
jgi:hypothetical protein